jgi:hypothetical protein
MNPFYMYVSIGALVLLIIVLIIVGVGMTTMHKQDAFPPVQNACPDYWDVSSNPVYCGAPVLDTQRNRGFLSTKPNQGIDTTDNKNIGLCAAGTKYFGCVDSGTTLLELQSKDTAKDFQYMKLNNNSAAWNRMYPGKTERCAQKSWAQAMNITWDGVSNFNGC